MRDSRTASRKIALCAMLMALAMIFSYVEVLIPINLGVPGIKLGIANLVVVVGRGSPDDFRCPHSSDGLSVRKWNVHSLQSCRRTPEFSCDVLTETYQRIQYHRRKYCRRRDAQCCANLRGGSRCTEPQTVLLFTGTSRSRCHYRNADRNPF